MKTFAAMTAAILLCMTAGADPIVTLTITEDAGSDRVNEPVTMGVPLPPAAVRRAETLTLTDASGTQIPAQFTVAARWPRDKSVKWVHMTFLASVKAKQSTTVTVGTGRPAAPPRELTAVKRGDLVTVVTGPLKFTVRGKGFNGFDEAWFDPTGGGNFDGDDAKVIDAKGMGAGGSTVVTPKGHFETWQAGRGTVEIEEAGPMRVVVKAMGSHVAGRKKALDYIVRFYAYAGSPVVRVQHTFVNRQGKAPADKIEMAKLSLNIPTALGTTDILMGGERQVHKSRGDGKIVQVSSDKYNFYAGLKEEPDAVGKGKSTKPLTTGWVNMNGDARGLAVGVRWFWQMYPKGFEVDGKGYLHILLYPEVKDADAPAWVKVPWDVYMGQSRTHDMTFLFHDTSRTAEQLQAFFAGTQRPLRAFAPPKYYARDTHCLGWVAEDDRELFGENWDKVQRVNRAMKGSIEAIEKKLDGFTYGGRTRDSYGFYTWGDTFHWSWKNFGNSPKQTPEWMFSYAGNYYDYPHASLLQFIRTGDRQFFDRWEPNAVHVRDVFTCQYHPRKELWGACRYNPTRNHVGLDDGTPYVSVEFNHNKSQCVYAHWYLTGDLRSLEVCKLLANNAYNNKAADRGWAARGIGAQLAVLYCAYERTGDPKYVRRMKGLAGNALKYWKRGKYPKGGKFMWGIANEGLVYYYWLTGDKTVANGLIAGLEKYGDAAGNFANMALGNAMAYHLTGEQKYADLAWKALSRGGISSRPKTFGVTWRNAAYALFFLSNAAKDFKPAK